MTPLLDALLAGLANLFAFIYALFAYLRPQTRIATATDGFLDLVAFDFFGRSLLRKTGQSDASFRSLIIANLLRIRGTRQAVIDLLTQLTGRTPIVFEPARPFDTGVWDGPGLAFDLAGGIGDLMPYQAFVTAFRPLGAGIANVAGLDIPTGAFDTASQAELIDLSFITDFLTDSDLYAAVNSVRPVGSVIWMQISS